MCPSYQVGIGDSVSLKLVGNRGLSVPYIRWEQGTLCVIILVGNKALYLSLILTGNRGSSISWEQRTLYGTGSHILAGNKGLCEPHITYQLGIGDTMCPFLVCQVFLVFNSQVCLVLQISWCPKIKFISFCVQNSAAFAQSEKNPFSSN